MKVRFVFLSACIIFIGLGFVVWSRSQEEPVDCEVFSQSPTVITDLEERSEVERIPIYPGAMLVTVEDSQSGGWQESWYETPDANDAVVNYYRKTMPAKGWQLYETPSSSIYPLFYWSDPTVAIPWGIMVNIVPDVREAGGTRLSILQRRVPDQNKIPIPSCARNLRESYIERAEDRYPVRTTTYTINAELKDVERYYKNAMTEHGWHSDEDPGSLTSPDGLTFYYGHQLASSSASAGVTIRAESQENGVTRVEIKTDGNDVEPVLAEK